MINSCVLVGRIATDPEMRYTASGTSVVNFRIAVQRRRPTSDGDDTDFFDVVAFGQQAEFVAQYLDKGALVGVEGRIQARTWQGNDGQTRRSFEIVANTVQGLESRQEAERRRAQTGSAPVGMADRQQPPAQQPQQQAPAPPQQPQTPQQPAQTGGQQQPAGTDTGPIGPDEDPFADQ